MKLIDVRCELCLEVFRDYFYEESIVAKCPECGGDLVRKFTPTPVHSSWSKWGEQ